MTSKAKNIHLHPEFKLGKQDYKEDGRTLQLEEFVNTDIQVPVSYDFDKKRAKFPLRMWGNDDYGNCVFAMQANQLLRVERVETRRTVNLFDEDVINRYKLLTGCQQPDDENDRGYVMLDANVDLRAGWTLNGKTYQIAAFGEVPINHQILRTCCYLFNGLQLGFDLPLTARQDTRNGAWVTTEGSGSEPRSWGGHAVYCKRFDIDNLYVLSWGREIRVSNAFIDKYCDEAWAIIDNIDPWRHAKTVLNVDAMVQKMRDNGIQVRF